MTTILAALFGALSTALVSIYIFHQRRKFEYTAEVTQSKRDMHSWANSVIDQMKRLEAAVEEQEVRGVLMGERGDERTLAILKELSILVDQGRLIFPNSHRNERIPENRDAARHGYRNLVLDPVKATIDRGFEGKLNTEAIMMMNGSFLTWVDAVLALPIH